MGVFYVEYVWSELCVWGGGGEGGVRGVGSESLSHRGIGSLEWEGVEEGDSFANN